MNQKEKRISRRIPVKLVANCYWYMAEDHQSRGGLSYTKDLSFHGARLVIKQGFKPATKIIIYFELPSSVVPVMAHSEIVWIKNWGNYLDSHRNHVMAGIKFLKLDDFDKNRLKEFLYNNNLSETCRTNKTI